MGRLDQGEAERLVEGRIDENSAASCGEPIERLDLRLIVSLRIGDVAV